MATMAAVQKSGSSRVKADSAKFSIFDPVITYEHREFYEKIVSELNGLFPICNQGKCSAVEISEDATEQEQITDLMVRVENFSHELLDVTKKLFDQFYQAKEEFHRMILSNVAYVKINLIDRNLLERTCDVRWWALETAFGECVEGVNGVRDQMADIAGQLKAIKAKLKKNGDGDSSETGKGNDGSSEQQLLSAIGNVLPHLSENVSIIVDVEAYEDYCRKTEVLISILTVSSAGNGLCVMIKDLNGELKQLHEKIQYSCERLEDINCSYTLYRDLVICDRDGFIIANANRETRKKVLGLNIADTQWFTQAVKTRDGTEYFAQDLMHGKIEDMPSLVYTTAIRENVDNNGAVIGAMGILFDFQGEAKIILDDYMPTDPAGGVSSGWYSFFTNESGTIIASSDQSIFEPGRLAHVPRHHRELQSGGKAHSYSIVEGQDAAIFTAKTDGYLEYGGLGWSSHLVVPRSAIFGSRYHAENAGISTVELMDSNIIPEINKETYEKIQEDKESIQLISLNGIVFASKLGKRGVALGPIFDQITKTGDFATSRMEDLLAEMAAGELALNLQALEMFSKQAIDLIDRNLFERSADIRWWSTDRYFWKCLTEPSEDAFQSACNRLKVINNSYTMYRNLILVDSGGEIVACSKMELRNELKKLNVSDKDWFQNGMRTQRSNEYAVQDTQKSPLEKHKDRSLIYSGGIRAGGAREGDAIGVLGVLFDWDTEARKILENCLPRDRDGVFIAGCAAFYTNASHEIMETSDPEKFPVGMVVNLPDEHRELGDGQSASGLYEQDGQRYLMGSSRTQGYREYRGLAWCAHVVRPL
ncbi:MAG: cache domain-containing protein [Planctomycetes bacterium]|nr:cache domain-containing protein [Planctomycetota bacterium]